MCICYSQASFVHSSENWVTLLGPRVIRDDQNHCPKIKLLWPKEASFGLIKTSILLKKIFHWLVIMQLALQLFSASIMLKITMELCVWRHLG